MSESIRRRLLVWMLFVLIGSVVPGALASAQADCICTLPQIVTRITICFDGQYRQVDVTYCSEKFCPASTTTDACSTSAAIDVRTLIKRIAPLGFTTTNAQGLVNATIAAMGLCCGNQAGLFNCPSSTNEYVWLVRWPKCASFTAGVLDLHEGGPCCGAIVRYRPNTPTPGLCETTVLKSCTVPGICPPVVVGGAPVIDLACDPFPASCCW